MNAERLEAGPPYRPQWQSLLAPLERAHSDVDALGRRKAALAHARLLHATDPEGRAVLGHLVLAALEAGEWDDWASHAAAVRSAAQDRPERLIPWAAFAACDDPAVHRAVAGAWAAPEQPVEVRCVPASRTDRARLRIVYLSSDLGDHPVARILAGILAYHDRNDFEIVIGALAPDDGSAERRRVTGYADLVVELHALPDAAAAERLAALQPDIVVDLNGLSGDARPGLLALRPGTLQVQYLGCPGTTGSSALDYVFVDRHVAPTSLAAHYSEAIVTLPDSTLVCDTSRPKPTPAQDRAAAGLPPDAFVLCGFASRYKLNPVTWDLWCAILADVPDAVLWLTGGGPAVDDSLRAAAEARRIEPSRLVFAQRVGDHDTHLSRLALADVYLDTWPYGAHSTAADALWMGVPVVAHRGAAFPARVASSLLHTLDLPELVADDARQYRATVVRLARDAEWRSELRRRLGAWSGVAPQFGSERLCRNLERAYRAIWARARAGETPDGIDLSRI